MMNTNLLARYIVKQAIAPQDLKTLGTIDAPPPPDPRIIAAVRGGLVGAGVGGLTQMLRSMFQSRRDEEENGSPSIMKGMLMGGLGGAGLNAAAMHYGPQINSWADQYLKENQQPQKGLQVPQINAQSMMEAGGGMPYPELA